MPRANTNRKRSSRAAPEPRRSAVEILVDIEKNQFTLDQALDRFYDRHENLPHRDQRLLHALVFGVLRWQGQLDWILGQFSRTPLKKMDSPVRAILRMGLFQVRCMDRIPASAAVNTAVNLAKKMGPPWTVKFVNAVLRKTVREHDQIPFPDPQLNPVESLAVQHAFPAWMVARWLERWGLPQTDAHCRAHNAIPPLSIRVNTLKTDLPRLKKDLAGEVAGIAPGRFLSDHLNISTPRTALPELNSFQQGGFQVQDEAAHLVALVADPQPGQRVLDACAGLGGKTGALAQLMDNEGTILAVDRSQYKLDGLTNEMQRLGVTSVATRTLDLNSPAPLADQGPYDRVLLDAPCSGLGVIRRNPDSKWYKLPNDIPYHGAGQKRLLRRLAPLVAAGGYLIYAVCSTEPEENEEVVRSFLAQAGNFRIARTHARIPPAALPLVDGQGFFRTRPALHGVDGFFAAKLQRMG